jgi:hypothetical protein
MTYFQGIADWHPEKRDALLEWLQSEDIDPNVVADDGRFSVHNGRISGRKFVLDDEGNRIIEKYDYKAQVVRFLKVPFNVEQKNPLPEGF